MVNEQKISETNYKVYFSSGAGADDGSLLQLGDSDVLEQTVSL